MTSSAHREAATMPEELRQPTTGIDHVTRK